PRPDACRGCGAVRGRVRRICRSGLPPHVAGAEEDGRPRSRGEGAVRIRRRRRKAAHARAGCRCQGQADRKHAIGGRARRARRAAELASAGLVIKSSNGDVTLPNPPVVQADTLKEKFDVVLLSCKAFDLDDAIKSFAPAVGSNTSIIPLLNGMLHLNALDEKFAYERVLGGLCAIAATLNEAREVVQLQPMQSLTFGERDGKM